MEIKVNVVNEMRKLRNTAYSDRTSWVEELIQNAQRAEAKNVMAFFGGDTVIFEDDGIGCTDPAVLFEKSTSGWGQSVFSQNPFGEGFFSTMMVSDMIMVESVGFKAIFDVNKILEEGNIDCVKVTSNKSRKKGMKIILSNMREEYCPVSARDRIRDIGQYISGINFTVKVYEDQPFSICKKDLLKGEGRNFTKIINTEGIKGWMAPFVWGCSGDGYDGDHVKVLAQERFVKNFPLNGMTGEILTEDGVIDLRSPDRKDIIMNPKYVAFKNMIINCRYNVLMDIIINGSDDDINKYESIITSVLLVEAYEKYMKFVFSSDDFMRDIVAKETGKTLDNLESIAMNNVDFNPGRLDDVKVTGKVGKVHTEDRENGTRTGESVLSGLLFYVDRDDLIDKYDRVKLAEYYGAKVVVARNRLEVNTLEYRRIPHIDSLSEVVDNELEVYNINVDSPEEKRALFIFDIISKLCGFDSNIFNIGDIKVYRRTCVQSKEVGRELIDTLGVAKGQEIYIDRGHLKNYEFGHSLIWNDTSLHYWDRKFIVENMEVVAHELAHVMYGTVDNTQEHAEMQIVITNKILNGLY